QLDPPSGEQSKHRVGLVGDALGVRGLPRQEVEEGTVFRGLPHRHERSVLDGTEAIGMTHSLEGAKATDGGIRLVLAVVDMDHVAGEDFPDVRDPLSLFTEGGAREEAALLRQPAGVLEGPPRAGQPVYPFRHTLFLRFDHTGEGSRVNAVSAAAVSAALV